MTLRCVFILVQVNKFVVLFCKEGIVVMGGCLRRLCLDMNVGWDTLFVLSWARVRRVAQRSVVSE